MIQHHYRSRTFLGPGLLGTLGCLVAVGNLGSSGWGVSPAAAAEFSAEAGASADAQKGVAADATATKSAPEPSKEAAPASAVAPAPATSEAKSSASSASTTEDAAGARRGRSPDPYERSTRFGSVPYLQRYKPEGNLWEVGLFMGLLFPSSEHNLKVPTLQPEQYQSPNFAVGSRLAYFPLSFLGAELETMIAASKTEVTEKSVLFYSARAHAVVQAPFWSIVPFAVVGGGALGAVSESMGHDGDPLFHWGLGVKAPVGEHVSGRLDFRQDFTQKIDDTQGTATSHFEMLLGATFTFERTAPPPPKDSDYDGLFDREDKCPTAGAFTADGCPASAPTLDSDGDGILDGDDECPKKAGIAPGGCPNPDADGDGIPVPCDACPEEMGKGRDGCPLRDADGDGVLDDKDRCMSEPESKNGFEDEDGCPDVVPAAVKKFSGVIAGISFFKDKADIDPKSFPKLDEAVKTLKEYPSVRIEVSGHTSSEGSAERNQELSVERAEAVKKYLVDHGVADSNVVTRGAGATEPIADNKTKAGKEKNRRIEFRILDHGTN